MRWRSPLSRVTSPAFLPNSNHILRIITLAIILLQCQPFQINPIDRSHIQGHDILLRVRHPHYNGNATNATKSMQRCLLEESIICQVFYAVNSDSRFRRINPKISVLDITMRTLDSKVMKGEQTREHDEQLQDRTLRSVKGLVFTAYLTAPQ